MVCDSGPKQLHSLLIFLVCIHRIGSIPDHEWISFKGLKASFGESSSEQNSATTARNLNPFKSFKVRVVYEDARGNKWSSDEDENVIERPNIGEKVKQTEEKSEKSENTIDEDSFEEIELTNPDSLLRAGEVYKSAVKKYESPDAWEDTEDSIEGIPATELPELEKIYEYGEYENEENRLPEDEIARLELESSEYSKESVEEHSTEKSLVATEEKEGSTTPKPEASTFHYELDLRGPTFELFKDFGSMQLTTKRYSPRTKDRGALDSALLERELMSYRVESGEAEKLRELLSDPAKLEEDYGESHRDFGSSFILPVLSATNYDNSTVPLIFSDIPVNVLVQLNIIHLANFDSEQMEYTIDLELEMRWFDLRLRNNYSKPVRIREKSVLDQIWRPDPYFVNSKYSYFHHVSFPNFRMRITPEGLVTYTMRTTLLPSCPMVFCKYPHDRQNCDLLISSIAYPRTFVNFSWHSQAVSFKSEIALPELQIKSMHTENCEVEGKLIRSSCLRLLFNLERDGGRFIVEKYVPSTLAMMFAWVAPYVPYSYEDVRIVTPIMVLLALVQMEKDDGSIRTSYLTSMNLWFGMMKIFSVLSLIESLVVLAFIKRSRAMEKNAARAVTELERTNLLAEKKKCLRNAHQLDRICRFLSPLTFVLFFNYYVLFVAQGDERECVRRQPFSILDTF